MSHPSPLPKTLGADLRALRRTRGLTLQQLADRLGRSVGWLSQVERDLSEPSITDLRHLAEALEVSAIGRASCGGRVLWVVWSVGGGGRYDRNEQ